MRQPNPIMCPNCFYVQNASQPICHGCGHSEKPAKVFLITITAALLVFMFLWGSLYIGINRTLCAHYQTFTAQELDAMQLTAADCKR